MYVLQYFLFTKYFFLMSKNTQATKIVTILILAKFRRPFSVKFGVPSSMNVRSDKYIPRYGMLGGSHLEVKRENISKVISVLKHNHKPVKSVP